MAGALTLEELENILESVGFEPITIETKVVSDEYAQKWGLTIDLKRYLRNSTIVAYKPLRERR